ncbi:MAG: hypothetical protein ACE5GF_10225 [Thermodesulfobacteriota bacterium]
MLSNRTNQPVDAGGKESAYSAESDIFLFGTPWQYRLKVVREHGYIELPSIIPNIIIDNVSHPMSLVGNWEGDISYWTYDRPSDCTTPHLPATNSDYSFLVTYIVNPGPSEFYVSEPPAKLPADGSAFTSRLLNMGFNFIPTAVPNHQSDRGIIYDKKCWETGVGCVPTWIHEEVIQRESWPGQSSSYEYSFTLRNSEPVDVTVTEITLAPLEPDSSNFNLFEVANINLPITIPACGGTADITLRYKPGFYQLPDFTSGHYRHKLILQTKNQWAESPDPMNEPFIKIHYSVSVKPE